MEGHGYFEVIVVGGGHAGAEAAWAASRLLGDRGRVAMVTMDPAAIGRMSCNPAIGGLGKGQIVREIDALGGLMAHAIDASGIQFRILNRSKGPAVQSPRAQADKYRYAQTVQILLREYCLNLTMVPDIVEEVLTAPAPAGTQRLPPQRPGGSAENIAASPAGNGRGPRQVTGVKLQSGRILAGRCVVLTTGTFLRGLMHTGETQTQGGRVGEAAAVGLSASLRRLGIELGRLKTGTPPRVARESIDFTRLAPQPGDDPPEPFSDLTGTSDSPRASRFPVLPQVPCHITWTNGAVHELIRANLHRAPMYSGQIQSRGPRYCPSIEDKVVRFADHPRHQVFLEPEGLATNEIYCNGISTSLPRDVQEEMVHRIAGLEQAKILRFGYAVEYDFAPTYQIDAALHTHCITGLFLAGQINGTSGYEEAAGQGLLAGINAARLIRGEPAFVLRRDQAYLGVMIDDLITKVPTEPYRMFTSRAEYRLALRSDNADQRLTPLAETLGMAEPARVRRWREKLIALQRVRTAAHGARLTNGSSAYDLFRRAEISWDELRQAEFKDGGIFKSLLAEPAMQPILRQVQREAHYAGYLVRQERAAARLAELEDKVIPSGFDFTRLVELRREAREALAKFRPRTLGQASRLEGLTPSDLTILLLRLARGGRAS